MSVSNQVPNTSIINLLLAHENFRSKSMKKKIVLDENGNEVIEIVKGKTKETMKKEIDDKIALLMKDPGRREDFFRKISEYKKKHRTESLGDPATANKFIEKN
jgi:hypothetical protein